MLMVFFFKPTSIHFSTSDRQRGRQGTKVRKVLERTSAKGDYHCFQFLIELIEFFFLLVHNVALFSQLSLHSCQLSLQILRNAPCPIPAQTPSEMGKG